MAVRAKNKKTRKRFSSILSKVILFFIIVLLILVAVNGFNFNLSYLFLVAFFLLISTALFLFFFAQFILPVTTLQERIKAVQRLFLYIIGDHGPAYFIENGEMRERKIDSFQKGPGVVILDTASAAVLRTPVKFKGAIGPGVAFTERDDQIGGIVNLKHQVIHIGPRQDEDPFIPIQKDENEAAYEARMTRKNESLVVTRNGIQICVNFSIWFKLDSQSGEGQTAYGYNPVAVEKAIIGQSVNFQKAEDNPNRMTNWNWYPVSLVIDILREYFFKYTLDELFPLSKSDMNVLDLITRQTKTRLSQSHYQNLDNYGREINETAFSKEHDLLKQRGIKFLDLAITNLRFPRKVEDGLQTRWQSSWMEVALKDRKYVENQHSLQSLAGKDQAMMDFAYSASKYLGSLPEETELSAKDLINLLMKGNRDTISQDPDLASLLEDEYRDLSDLTDWVNATGEV